MKNTKNAPRPVEVATKDWAEIALTVRIFQTPEVSQQRTTRTVVSKKWIFITQD